MVPQNYVKLTGAQATQMVRLVEALEEHDDVQHVTRISTSTNPKFRRLSERTEDGLYRVGRPPVDRVAVSFALLYLIYRRLGGTNLWQAIARTP